jgi:hypothetical protein
MKGRIRSEKSSIGGQGAGGGVVVLKRLACLAFALAVALPVTAAQKRDRTNETIEQWKLEQIGAVRASAGTSSVAARPNQYGGTSTRDSDRDRVQPDRGDARERGRVLPPPVADPPDGSGQQSTDGPPSEADSWWWWWWYWQNHGGGSDHGDDEHDEGEDEEDEGDHEDEEDDHGDDEEDEDDEDDEDEEDDASPHNP